MRKILCLLLSCIMVIGLCACGNNEKTSTTNNNKDTNLKEDSSIEYPNTIRKNGEYPEDIQELTEEEMNFHNQLIFNAIINLDISVLEKYTDEESKNAVDALRNIKKDDTYRALYEKSFGDFKYMPSCNYYLSKSIFYTFCKWYDDCEKNGSCPVDNVEELTKKQVDEIYDKHYVNAPYEAKDFNSYRVWSKIVDGKIIYKIDDIFAGIGYQSIAELNPKGTEFTTNAYPKLIIYNYEGLDFNEILTKGNCPRYKEIMSKDLNKMIEIVDNIKIEEDDYYKRFYENYYKNDEIRVKIQKYMDENVEVLRAPHIVGLSIKANIDKTYPFYNFTEEEKNNIKSLSLISRGHIGDFEETFSMWDGYHDILTAMEDNGILEVE